MSAPLVTIRSAHDPVPSIAQLLYRSSLQFLLDFVFVLLCRTGSGHERLLERVQHLLDR